MKQSQLLQKLSFMELSDLSQAGEGNGVITQPLRNRVISIANDGLLDLHTRFALLNKELILQTREGLNRYYLRQVHALTSTDPDSEKYIVDTEEDPFLGDLTRVDRILNSEGCPVWLNDHEKETGNLFQMLSFDSLYVQNPSLTLKVFYRARHQELDDDDDAEINLPPMYEQALRSFIGWKVYAGQKTQESQIKAQQLEVQYTNHLQGLIDANITNEYSPDHNERFEKGGWM